jgi:hypothetical protein
VYDDEIEDDMLDAWRGMDFVDEDDGARACVAV